MKKLSNAFSFIFSDDDWFNKVLVGGFFFLLIPLLFGAVMIFGFQVELAKRIQRNESGMPMWRNFRRIVNSGITTGCAAFFYLSLVLIVLFILDIGILSLSGLAVLATVHFVWNPLILTQYAKTGSFYSCLNPLALLRLIAAHIGDYLFITFISAFLVIIAVLLGWMWIVVGWTLLIFLAMIVQTVVFAKL